jgi:hypothetical protein
MEQLIEYSKPKIFKPVNDREKDRRKLYYAANAEIIKARAREYSRNKYAEETHREAVREKNANYRLIMKKAKEFVLQQYAENPGNSTQTN